MKFIVPTMLGFIAVAAADLFILAGDTNDPIGGGTGQNAYVIGTDQTPNCDNLGSPIIIGEDASGGGVACDGCELNQTYDDWVITRFEMYDGPNFNRAVTKQQYGSLTAYLEDGDRYGLNAGSGDGERRIGRCERVRGQTLQCPRGLTTDFVSQIFTCFGETEPLDAA